MDHLSVVCSSFKCIKEHQGEQPLPCSWEVVHTLIS